MNLAQRKYIPCTIAASIVAAVAVAALAPAEQKLGDTVKLIYLHASITWVALATFGAAAVIGVLALVRRSDSMASWSTAALSTGTLFWVFHFAFGLVVMKLAWGGWFWSEPRVKAGMLILGVAIAATLLAYASERRWVGPVLSIGVVLFVTLLLASPGRIFHPAGAIRESDSTAIKGSVAVILLLVSAASAQTARLLNRSRAPSTDPDS